MCKTLQVSTSGYYGWRDRPQCQRKLANAALLAHIHEAHAMSDATYGMPRIRAELHDAGIIASRKRIARLMRQAHIQGVSRRRGFCVTTCRDKSRRAAPDLVKRQFVATDINQLWVADMTYIPTWAGFVYLAVVTDVYSRKVVGWMFGQEMTAQLVISALNMALTTRRPQSVIHHSDQGSQIGFNRLSQHLNYVGVVWEKQRRGWKTQAEARLAVFTWIEGWYNPRRRHSSLGQISPMNFERKHQTQKSQLPHAPHGLPTVCFAPVDKTTHAQFEDASPCPQASTVDNPAWSIIVQAET